MDFETSIVGDRAYIKVTADLNCEQAGEALTRCYNQIVEQGKKIVILDMDEVKIINSYGIGKVLMMYKRLKTEGGVLKVKPLKGFVKEIFELLMLDRLLEVEQ